MSQQQTFKRQSKIPIKLGIAKADNGLRLTVNSPRLINLANTLMRKSMQEIDNGNRLSNNFRKVRESLTFTEERFDNQKINTLVNSEKIPNLRFLNTLDLIAETTINDVFTDPEIEEWIELFQIFVKLMKKINKEFDLLD
tara:strand:- start:316 stop:735 length:420 start_codon:yes stop_codon:yes gene_type:complete